MVPQRTQKLLPPAGQGWQKQPACSSAAPATESKVGTWGRCSSVTSTNSTRLKKLQHGNRDGIWPKQRGPCKAHHALPFLKCLVTLTAPLGFWLQCCPQNLFRIKPFTTCSWCLRLSRGCFHDKSWTSGPGHAVWKHSNPTWPRAQHPSRCCDTLAFQPHTLAAVLRRSEGEDQVSIIVFLYSKRIFFKCCNQIPA